MENGIYYKQLLQRNYLFSFVAEIKYEMKYWSVFSRITFMINIS